MNHDLRAMARRAFVTAALLAAAKASAQHPLVTLPLGDPAYAQLDGLARQGCRQARVSPYRPYRVARIRAAIVAARAERSCAGPVLAALAARFVVDSAATDAPAEGHEVGGFAFGGTVTVQGTALRNAEFRPLWRDVRPTGEGTPPLVGAARARVTWSGGARLVAVSEVYAETDPRNDPRRRARTFRTTSGVLDVSEAYLAGKLGPLVLSVGRTREAWFGEGAESLVLSANGPPIDRVAATAEWSRWEARAILGSLDDVVLDPVRDSLAASRPQRMHRMIVGHALTYRPAGGWDISLGETALLTRRGGGIDLAYANPLVPFLMAEHDTSRAGAGSDNNNLTAFGAVHGSVGRATFTAELLVDDIQIDAADRKVVPDQLGWRLQGSAPLSLPLPTSVTIGYERVDSYTYLRDLYAEVYQHYDAPLGSALGPGSDVVRASAQLWPSGRLRVAGGIARWRRGALRIDERPAQRATGHAGEPFPAVGAARPFPQRSWLADLSVAWLDRVLPVTVHAELARIEHPNNGTGGVEHAARVQVTGTWRFRYP